MISNTAKQDFMAHALEAYPCEAIGYCDLEGNYRRLQNISNDPKNEFKLGGHIGLLMQNKATIILHSHTNGRNEPSSADITACDAVGIPYGLSLVNGDAGGLSVTFPFFWGASIPSIPLKGRKWRNGPSGTDNGGDCYALVKDFYFQELGIQLPEYGRDADDWKDGANHFMDNFKNAGFVEVEKTNVRRGDILLIGIHSKYPNHCGVIINEQTMLHHMQNKLSGEDLASRWLGLTQKVIRLKNDRD